MKKYYPVNLDITNRRCVIIGGGDVAERKAERLIECGAQVTIVSPLLTPLLEERKKARQIVHVDKDYEEKTLHGAFMVIGATDRNEINAQISQDALSLGILVNIVDDPDKCNFILPSLVQQGDLSIAISTGGKSPALAKKLREDMQQQYGPEYQVLLRIMGSLRKKVLTQSDAPEDNKALFVDLVHSDILQAIRDGNRDLVNKIIYEHSGIDMDVSL
ncbi:MAG: bifunctional precorrin-2 dehydrogenase/sirohydrochlorin ferrochelatase [Deltaproteobacteria bacterium]|nr:bifunctional precorrin-2 dehydrogenase/sirohydrochlorin ferrochelatase [Deltaproteobacteria bacterium]